MTVSKTAAVDAARDSSKTSRSARKEPGEPAEAAVEAPALQMGELS